MMPQLQELQAKHNLSNAEREELSKYLREMESLPTSKNEGALRREHQRLRRVLTFLTRNNEALQREVLQLLWEISRARDQRRIQERRNMRKLRTDTQGVIEI